MERISPRSLEINNDSSSASQDERVVTSLRDWTVWMPGFARTLFEFGVHAAPTRRLLLAYEYTPLFWAENIIGAFHNDDDPEQSQTQNERRCCNPNNKSFGMVQIISFLNLIVTVYDIVQAVRFGSWTFLFSAILRLVLLSFLSFFHFAVGFMFWGMCKDKLLRIVNVVCAIFAGIVFLASIVLLIYFAGFNNLLQLEKLNPPSRFAVPTISRTPVNVACQ
jgi:hypothetical protein